MRSSGWRKGSNSRAIATFALKSGLDVYVEKPASFRLDEGAIMAHAAREQSAFVEWNPEPLGWAFSSIEKD